MRTNGASKAFCVAAQNPVSDLTNSVTMSFEKGALAQVLLRYRVAGPMDPNSASLGSVRLVESCYGLEARIGFQVIVAWCRHVQHIDRSP